MTRFALVVWLAAALASPAFAQPAVPTADPSLACPLAGLPAEHRSAAIAEASRDLLGTSADNEPARRAAHEALAASARRCAATHRWTENQGNVAFQYALMQLAREGMVSRYAAQNVDLAF